MAGGEPSPVVEETITFSLHAEIYRVLGEVQHVEGSDVIVDWGLVRGVDQAVKQIVLLNNGRFPFTWQAGWKKQVKPTCACLAWPSSQITCLALHAVRGSSQNITSVQSPLAPMRMLD